MWVCAVITIGTFLNEEVDYISHFNWIWKKLAKLRSFKSIIVIGVLESLCTSEFLKPYV